MNFRRLHSWDLTPTEAIEFQNKLKSKIRLVPFNIQPHLVAGVDVSFVEDKAIGVAVVLKFPELKLIE